MIILAIDTSTDYLSLAILKGGRIVRKLHKKADRRHSILLVPTIEKLLKEERLKIRDVDCFAISVGPGSFTGLRIGVTVVKGFAYALKKRIVAVPTLDVIAQNVKNFKGVICPVLDARKNKVYAAIYKSDGQVIKRVSKYMLLGADELLNRLSKYDKVIFLGDTANNNFNKDWRPRADTVARLGAEYFKNKKFVKAEDLEPMYIYSKECDITGR